MGVILPFSINRNPENQRMNLLDGKIVVYLQSMRKEMGKWLMDIAKYITTAVLLTSLFSEMSSQITYNIIGVSIALLTLICGLILIKEKKEE